LAGNPLATAAGLATLQQLGQDEYMELLARARHLSALLRDACASQGVRAQFPVVGTLVGMYFGDAMTSAPTNFDDAKSTDEKLYAQVFHALLASGVAMPPGAYEALFVGLAHSDTVMDDLASRVALAMGSLQR
jgi:glutamate-1-semialdehyde 2,1-aminomutase